MRVLLFGQLKLKPYQYRWYLSCLDLLPGTARTNNLDVEIELGTAAEFNLDIFLVLVVDMISN